MKNKPFDAVAMMRKIRDRLGKKYYGRSAVLLKDLEEIKIKYGLKDHRSKPVHQKKATASLYQNRKAVSHLRPEK